MKKREVRKLRLCRETLGELKGAEPARVRGGEGLVGGGVVALSCGGGAADSCDTGLHCLGFNNG